MVYNDVIYGATYPDGKLFSYTPGVSTGWTEVADALNYQGYICSLIEYNGIIYAGTSTGLLLIYTPGSSSWIKIADQLNGQTSIFSLLKYNGAIYSGTWNGGRLFVYQNSEQNNTKKMLMLINNEWVEKPMKIFNNGVWNAINMNIINN